MTGKERVCPAPPAEPGHGRIAILRSCPVFFSGRLISDSGKRAGKTGGWPVSLTWTDRSILCKKLPERPAEARGASGGGAGKALRRLAFRDNGGPERRADCDAKVAIQGYYSLLSRPDVHDIFPRNSWKNRGLTGFHDPRGASRFLCIRQRASAALYLPLFRGFPCERASPPQFFLPPLQRGKWPRISSGVDGGVRPPALPPGCRDTIADRVPPGTSPHPPRHTARRPPPLKRRRYRKAHSSPDACGRLQGHPSGIGGRDRTE